jgi:hypothetical protein
MTLATRGMRRGGLPGTTTRRPSALSAPRSAGRRKDGAGLDGVDAGFRDADARSCLTHRVGASHSSRPSSQDMPPHSLPSGSPNTASARSDRAPCVGERAGSPHAEPPPLRLDVRSSRWKLRVSRRQKVVRIRRWSSSLWLKPQTRVCDGLETLNMQDDRPGAGAYSCCTRRARNPVERSRERSVERSRERYPERSSPLDPESCESAGESR